MPHSKGEDATISFEVSKDFTGIMHGEPNDESEGCTLTGNFIVDVHRPLKVRRLMVYFEGRCKVNLKRSSTYNMVSTPEISETRSLFSRQQHFLGQDGILQTLQPGKHLFPFEFELPSHLPASFQGKRGYIRYRLTGAIYRPMFSHDLRTSTDVVIKRSLMDDLTPISNDRFVETVYGKKHTQKLRYSATAPTMAYREGGLVRLNVAMQLLHPDLHQVKSVTCALRERVQYRTTDSQQQTLFSRSDDLFPLGYSTFYPDQDPDYDPTKHQDYNAIFRLIPRVNADTNSRLVKVTHSLIVNIILEKTNDDQDDPFDSYELENDDQQQQQQPSSSSSSYHAADDSEFQTWATDDQVDDKTRLQQQLQSQSQQHQHDDYFSLSTTSNNNNHNNNLSVSTPTSPLLSPAATMTPPYSRTTSPTTSRANSPTLSRSSSSSSIASIFSLKHIHDDLLKLENKANKHHHHHKQQTTCTLEIPLVVTSREHAWDGHMPSPPSYRTTASEAPPGYSQSIEQLPPVPNYQQPDSQNNNNNMESNSVAAI